MRSENDNLQQVRYAVMCAAHEEIDQIHEAEEAAKKQLDEAEASAKKIREGAEKEAKNVVEAAEKEAKMAAQRSKDGLEARRMEIEQKVLKETDKTIAEIEISARGEVKKAVDLVYKVITGEE
jgi:vacuolar-type H+-ATPase subunit H